jgi:hypothetical protein
MVCALPALLRVRIRVPLARVPLLTSNPELQRLQRWEKNHGKTPCGDRMLVVWTELEA